MNDRIKFRGDMDICTIMWSSQYYIFALEELTSSYEIGIGFGIMEKHWNIFLLFWQINYKLEALMECNNHLVIREWIHNWNGICWISTVYIDFMVKISGYQKHYYSNVKIFASRYRL